MRTWLWVPAALAADGTLQDAAVRDAAARAVDWTSYRAVSQVSIEAKTAGGGKSSTDLHEVVFEKGKGAWLKTGTEESIRVVEGTVIRGPGGAWIAKFSKKTKPAPIWTLPHQPLRALENSVEVAAAEKGDSKIFTVTLTPEGALALLVGLKADEGMDVKCVARLTVGRDGEISNLVLDATWIQPSKSGEETVTSARIAISFTQVGNASFEIPEEAKKALDESN